jgi:hypothetical protein
MLRKRKRNKYLLEVETMDPCEDRGSQTGKSEQP